jgi:TetR/AcrR family transcriptional regulator
MGTLERKARERIGRENMILDAAEEVFFSRGFDQSTMDDVANNAELSKGSLYNYFKNKNELCIGIVGRSFRLLIEYMEKSLVENASGLDKISGSAKAFMLFKQENPEYYCALQSYQQHSGGCGIDSKFLDSTLDENSHINGLIVTFVKEGIADGSIDESVIPEKMAGALWGEFNGILPGFDLNTNSAEAYEYALELIINGLKR